MFVIINQNNLVRCITPEVKYVGRLKNNRPILADPARATAIYATADDQFYPLAPQSLGEDSHTVVAVDSVPAEVTAGYWYYNGAFYTTPELQQAYQNSIQSPLQLRADVDYILMMEGLE